MHEENYTLSEQLTHHSTRVARVPGTVEVSDFFGFRREGGESVVSELCYSLDAIPIFDSPSVRTASETDLTSMVDELLALNPDFARVTK